MPPKRIAAAHFSADTAELLMLLSRYGVKYLIVGGEAVIYYGHARLTGDIDIYYERSKKNSERLFHALKDFWSGDIPGVQKLDELLEKGAIFQFGRPPNRIDLINEIDNVSFEKAWEDRETVEMEYQNLNIPIYYIGLKQLISNKESVKRPKDLEDLKFLHQYKAKAKT
jgi:hypothetical protein